MNKLITRGDFVLRAELHKVPALPDAIHLKLTTQLLGTRFPDERHTAFSATFERIELIKLRDLIDLELLEIPCSNP